MTYWEVTSVADGWVRAVQTDENNFGFFGRLKMVAIAPGQTVLRTWWNVGLYHLADSVNVYPPGSSILRVGVCWMNFDADPEQHLTPISDASADWMGITTLNPSGVQLSRAVNVAWQTNWGFPIDLSIKSMRRNDTEDTWGLQVAYEFALNDEEEGFTISGWWSSLDVLVRTPD